MTVVGNYRDLGSRPKRPDGEEGGMNLEARLRELEHLHETYDKVCRDDSTKDDWRVFRDACVLFTVNFEPALLRRLSELEQAIEQAFEQDDPREALERIRSAYASHLAPAGIDPTTSVQGRGQALSEVGGQNEQD